MISLLVPIQAIFVTALIFILMLQPEYLIPFRQDS